MHRVIAVAALLLLMGCAQEESKVREVQSIRITGSESEKPLVVQLSAEYYKTHPEAPFEIKGGGTDDGFAALFSGKADIASASRIISYEELSAAQAAGIDVHQVIIAQDVISIITHPSVGVQHILMEDLAKIYSGVITNWKELGGPDQPIKPIGRKPGSGTRSYMLHRLALENFHPSTMEFGTYEEIVSAVIATPGSVAYVSHRFIRLGSGAVNPAVWVMNVSLNGMPYASPLDAEDIAYGDYPLMRPLFQYYGAITAEQKAFIAFELSDEGQTVVERSGYITLSDNQREINRRKAMGAQPDSLGK